MRRSTVSARSAELSDRRGGIDMVQQVLHLSGEEEVKPLVLFRRLRTW